MTRTPEFMATEVAHFYHALRNEHVPEDVAKLVTNTFTAGIVEDARDNRGVPSGPPAREGEPT